jgi:transcription initiation factor TFIID subunit 1
MPAIKLHPQYFKPLLHVKELRSFHRPALRFPINDPITFSRVKAMKKKKYKAIDPAEMMRTPKDLTIKDTSRYVLVEYSEEYPPAIQNVGMATLIYNYYRKKDEKDNFVPKMANGGPFILEGVDTSPFFGFGDVEPGQTIQVLYNNLVRTPLFPQDVSKTDFLVIRHTYQGVTKYFLREIPNIYVAGQCYPVQEVPRPQARKITQSLKLRLQVVGYRLMRQDPYQRLNYEKLRIQFPMFTDMQIRQKLKEFAQYLKKGENTGWWKLKPGVILLDEDGIRKLVTPESICLNESTLVAQQRLKDAGYGAEDMKEENDDDGDRESHLDIELQLAPWITTKNFLIAATGKGMVQLFGPGDPTGRGEGFSYIRASMKEMFFHHNETEESRNAFIHTKKELTLHKYSIVEQQQVYRAEINRIWSAQFKSLSARESDKKDSSENSKAKRAVCLVDIANGKGRRKTTTGGNEQKQSDFTYFSTVFPWR